MGFPCIPFHLWEAPLPPPLLAGFMQRAPGIRRNSMRAGPRSGARKALPMREGELSRKWKNPLKHLSETTRTKRGASPKGTCRRASRASRSTRPRGRALRSGCGRG
jgi:hypothetical protein